MHARALQPVVELGGPLADDLVDLRRERVRRQAQPGLASEPSRSTIAPASRAIFSIARVLAQRMDEQRLDAAVAGMQRRVLEQARARSRGRAPRAAPRRRTRPGAGRPRRRRSTAVGEVGHGDQLEAAVEDAEHLVALEVERVDVACDLRVGGQVAEAQVAVERSSSASRCASDALAVAGAERADRHPVGGVGRWRRGVPRSAAAAGPGPAGRSWSRCRGVGRRPRVFPESSGCAMGVRSSGAHGSRFRVTSFTVLATCYTHGLFVFA